VTGPIIETPKGAVFVGKSGKAKLEFNTNFQPRRQQSFSRAQRILDSEVLRGCEPYIPLLTGTLIKTGILGTDVGSGLVQWIAPYSKAQYYRPKKAGSQTGLLRGPFWFERWKHDHGKETVAKVEKIAGAS
jgi:hypothetical protein